MNKKIKYDDYYIAFLDILGFSNIVKEKDANYIHKIFTNVKMAKKLVPKDRGGSIKEKTKFYFFSDSIVVAIPSNEENAFASISSNCLLIQHALWSYGPPVWLRGAIVKGSLYCGKTEIFGPALVEAYKLEENLAKYPRIIMTKDTYEKGILESIDREEVSFISSTDDGLKMISTLPYPKFLLGGEALRLQIENTLKFETNPNVREKYVWLRNYFNKFISIEDEREEFRTPID